MNLALLHALWAWSLQAAVLVVVGALFGLLLRWRDDPRGRLLLWRLVLAIAMLLPPLGLVPPYRPGEARHAPFQHAILMTTSWAGAVAPAPPDHLAPLLVALLITGIAYRAGRLGASALALRRLSRGPELVLEELPALERQIGAQARLLTAQVSQPFTFGVRAPVIVVPPDFAREPDGMRRAVLAHELVHVRRRDWLQELVEEACATVLWFHPGIWFAIAELRLAREEIVDREAARVVGSRRAYVGALVAFASRRDVRPARALAFFRHRQLTRRIAALSKEVSMSPRLLISSGIAAGLLLTMTARAAQAAFPGPDFQAPSYSEPAARSEPSVLEQLAYQVPADAPPPAKVHDVRPVYPASVTAVVTSAMFAVRLVIEVDGAVAEARIVTQRVGGPGSSPEALASAVARLSANTLAAVRQWRFEPPAKAPLAMTVTVSFTANPGGRAALPAPAPPAPGAGRVTPPVPIYQPHPVYPEAAKRAGTRGVVRVAVTVGADGVAREPRVIQSIPGLDAAALEAARHWTFRPGTREGTPVEVETEITFAFELHE